MTTLSGTAARFKSFGIRHKARVGLAAIILIPVHIGLARASEPDWHLGGHHIVSQSITSEQDIALAQRLTLDVQPDQTASLRGRVSGPMGGLQWLIKTGAGRLELWGDNSAITKQAILQQGTLHLAGRYALGNDLWANLVTHSGTTLSYAPDAVVVAGLHLVDATSPTPGADPDRIHLNVDSGLATQLGTIHGSVPLVKTGAGTLRLLEAANHPDSYMDIAQGAVQLNNQFSGRLNVFNNTLLTGNGRAGWITVGSGGALVPTGRMTVDNDLHFQPDSILNLRIWADGQNDSIHVLGGTTHLDGHVLVLPQDPVESWKQGMDYVILQNDAGLDNSRFASVESVLPYLDSTLSYDAHQVTLRLSPSAATTPPLRDPSAGWAASVRSQLTDDSRFIRDAVYTHARQHEGFWTQAFHSSGDRRAAHGAPGDERRISGMLLGINRSISSQWRLGVYGGASTTQMLGGAAEWGSGPTANVSSTHLGVMAHHQMNTGTQLTAGVAHSWHRVRSQRTAGSWAFHHDASSRYRANTSQIFAQAQHPLWASDTNDTVIEPFASLAWVHLKQRGHTENGGPLAARLSSDRSDVLFSRLGITASHQQKLPLGIATVTGTLAWRHASGDIHRPVRYAFRDDPQGIRHNAHGLPVTRNAWQLQLGLKAELNRHTWFSVNYAGQYGGGGQDHGVQAGVTVMW